MILDEINKKNIEAMKNKDALARVALGTVKNKIMLAQIEKKAKNEELKEDEIVAILLKTCKELTEEAENYKKAGNALEEQNVLKQSQFLKKY